MASAIYSRVQGKGGAKYSVLE